MFVLFAQVVEVCFGMFKVLEFMLCDCTILYIGFFRFLHSKLDRICLLKTINSWIKLEFLCCQACRKPYAINAKRLLIHEERTIITSRASQHPHSWKTFSTQTACDTVLVFSIHSQLFI